MFVCTSFRIARPCALHQPLARDVSVNHRRACNTLLKLHSPSFKHGRRRRGGCHQATTCIAAPEVVERTFADGKVRKVGYEHLC